MRYIVLDLEAVAISDVESYLEPVSAPDNYKDEQKIAVYVKEAKAKQAERAALDIDLARIVAIGYQLDGCAPTCELMKDEIEESKFLDWFWNFWRQGNTNGGSVAITFNGMGYDMPLLMRRSLYLGVKAPQISLDRYRHPNVIDLMELLSLNGRMKLHSLQFYAKRFGLEMQQDIKGAEIAKAVAENDWAAVEKHCLADVSLTYQLAKRMGVLG